MKIDECKGKFVCEKVIIKKEGQKYGYEDLRLGVYVLEDFIFLGPVDGEQEDLWQECTLPGNILVKFPFRPLLIASRKGKLNTTRVFSLLKSAYYTRDDNMEIADLEEPEEPAEEIDEDEEIEEEEEEEELAEISEIEMDSDSGFSAISDAEEVDLNDWE